MKQLCEAIKAQFAPKLIQHPDIAQCERRLKANLRGVAVAGGTPLGAQKRIDNRINLTIDLIETAQGEQRALPRFAGLVAKRLYQLHVSARARAGEFHEHVRSLAQLRGNANTSHVTTCHYKQLSASTAKRLIFLDRDAKTQPKTPLFRPQVSNFGGQCT